MVENVIVTAEFSETKSRGGGYGWVIVVLAAVAMLATLPGRTHGLGMITERLLSDSSLELTRVSYGHLNLWATLIGALFCLPCGWMLDRIGLRYSVTFVVAALGAVVLTMTQSHGMIWFAILITLTRGFGQSALSVVSIAMVGKWFQARLPLAMGIYSILVSVFFAAAFGWGATQKDLDWRTQWQSLGWFLIGLSVVMAIVVRSPTGQVDSPATETPSSPADFTLAEGLATPAFWTLSIATSFYGLVAAGMSLFNESLLVQQGFGKGAYYKLSIMTLVIGMIANLATGWLTTRVRMTYAAGLAMLLLAIALLALPFVKTYPALVCYAVAMGTAGGMVTVLFFAAYSRFFGRSHLGRIQGVAQMMTVFASALGPVVLAEVFNRTGSYLPAVRVMGALSAVLAVVVTMTPLPRRVESVPELQLDAGASG